MPLLGWLTDGGTGYRAEVSVLAGRWQELSDFYPVQFDATESTSIAGLELLVSFKAEVAVAIGDGFHAAETEGGGFSLTVDLDVDFVLIHLNFLCDRPGVFRSPLTPGRPAITPLGVRKGIYRSSACSWASSSSSDPKRVSQERRPA
jgi:hypothetical protein